MVLLTFFFIHIVLFFPVAGYEQVSNLHLAFEFDETWTWYIWVLFFIPLTFCSCACGKLLCIRTSFVKTTRAFDKNHSAQTEPRSRASILGRLTLLVPNKTKFMLKCLSSPNTGKSVCNRNDGVFNSTSSGVDDDKPTTFRLHDLGEGTFVLECVSLCQGYKGKKFVYNRDGVGLFSWTNSPDEATVFKAVGDKANFYLVIVSSYKDRGGRPDYKGTNVVKNEPNGNLSWGAVPHNWSGPDMAAYFKVAIDYEVVGLFNADDNELLQVSATYVQDSGHDVTRAESMQRINQTLGIEIKQADDVFPLLATTNAANIWKPFLHLFQHQKWGDLSKNATETHANTITFKEKQGPNKAFDSMVAEKKIHRITQACYGTAMNSLTADTAVLETVIRCLTLTGTVEATKVLFGERTAEVQLVLHYDTYTSLDAEMKVSTAFLVAQYDSMAQEIKGLQPKNKTELQQWCIAYHQHNDTSRGIPWGWDTSLMTDLSALFFVEELEDFNSPIGSWDVSNVTDFSNMFTNTKRFDQPLNTWNVAKAETMKGMFKDTKSFDQPLCAWDVSNVDDFGHMFKYSEAFDQSLKEWNVKGKNRKHMFQNAKIQPPVEWGEE